MIGIFAIATLALSSAQENVEERPVRTAFMCSFERARSANGSVQDLVKPRPFGFLLSGTAQSKLPDTKVELFDPTQAMGTLTDRRFDGGDASVDSFSLIAGTKGKSGAKIMVLTLTPENGNPVYRVGLGDFGPGTKPELYGVCFAVKSSKADSDFMSFAKDGGFKQ